MPGKLSRFGNRTLVVNLPGNVGVDPIESAVNGRIGFNTDSFPIIGTANGILCPLVHPDITHSTASGELHRNQNITGCPASRGISVIIGCLGMRHNSIAYKLDFGLVEFKVHIGRTIYLPAVTGKHAPEIVSAACDCVNRRSQSRVPPGKNPRGMLHVVFRWHTACLNPVRVGIVIELVALFKNCQIASRIIFIPIRKMGNNGHILRGRIDYNT